MAAKFDSQDIFNNLSSTINQLHFGRTQNDRKILNKTLDELNSLNYRYTIVTSPTKAVLLINQCCTFIPTDDEVLVQKFCKLLCCLISRQSVVIEGRTLTLSVQWALSCLKVNDKAVLVDVLQALSALLRSNGQNIPVGGVVKDIRALIERFENGGAAEVILGAVHCLEACTTVPVDGKTQNPNDAREFEQCAEIFLRYLTQKHKFDELFYNKILIMCLSGLQNIIIEDQDYWKKELGTILGIIKTFMLYNVKNVDYIVPQKLMPSTLSVPEIAGAVTKEKKGGKLTKQRKHRPSTNTKKETKTNEDWLNDGKTNGYVPATVSLDYNSDNGLNVSGSSKLKTSDSDFSDSEGGRLAKLSLSNGRVRQASLNLFYNIVKQTDKPIMFSYWSSFIPEVALSSQHNLITCFLKDPSARGRMGALNVLLLLLTSSKMYLSQAETSDKSTSFTPFSVVLGLMLKELHKGLSLALNELSIPVLTQVLKCFAALVQATPYHRMSPGIVTKIVRNVKSLVCHKDASVQVTALIVLGCVLASEPTVPETKQVMLKLQPTNDEHARRETITSKVVEQSNIDDFDFAEFSSDDETTTATNSDDEANMPWLLKRCLYNLGVVFDGQSKLPADGVGSVPAPVKLESLQVLSAMSRNYFEDLMAPHLTYITRALDLALSDRYTDLRLHAGRAVDFIGQAMCRYLSNEDIVYVDKAREQCLAFWQTLLNRPLISLLQCEQYPVLRAIGCDCLGSIGSHIFEQLPRERQILCVTLLFSCTRDEENSVKGAAVRALAICVLFPSLREDPGFVVDTSEAIYRTLHDENLMVRVKSSWSLGNLSDALVLNSKCNNMEELPENLLLKLISASINGANDYDKIKMNAVRALGNLLQLLTDEIMAKNDFQVATEQALKVLVKNCTTGSNMKVRWNSCYALGNAMKNPGIYKINSICLINSSNLQISVFQALMDLVGSFRNFKVRINAAVALSSPPAREYYGEFYVPVWLSLLKALENSQQMEDFTEYKHRDHLVEQICLALGHLTIQLTVEDLIPLQDYLVLYSDVFKGHMHKVLERLLPEKSTALFSASCCLAAFGKRFDLNVEQRKVVDNLKEVFVIDLRM